MSENGGHRVLKIIVDDENHTIVHVSEQYDGFLFQYYDNDASTHRLRETLEFKNMNDAIRFVKEENSCYEIIDEFEDNNYYY